MASRLRARQHFRLARFYRADRNDDCLLSGVKQP